MNKGIIENQKVIHKLYWKHYRDARLIKELTIPLWLPYRKLSLFESD